VLCVAIVLSGSVLGQPQQAPVDRPQGLEFVAGVNRLPDATAVMAQMFIPASASLIRCVLVVLRYGSMCEQLYFGDLRRTATDAGCAVSLATIGDMRGPQSAMSPESVIRNAAAGSGEAMLELMDRFAQESGHQELKTAPMLFWGFSAAASFGTTFAALYPDRTIGFVRYHTHRRGLPATLDALRDIPALLIAGGQDQAAGTDDAEEMWRAGRALGAPWTFAVEPEAQHSSLEVHAVTARELTIPWVAGVLRQRLSSSGRLQAMPVDRAWFAAPGTDEALPYATFVGDRRAANWLPDERTAQGWRVVTRPGR
jgi:predicted esterase